MGYDVPMATECNKKSKLWKLWIPFNSFTRLSLQPGNTPRTRTMEKMISRERESSVRIQIQHFFYFHGTDNNFKPSRTCAFNISEENRIKLILSRKVSSPRNGWQYDQFNALTSMSDQFLLEKSIHILAEK